MEKQIGDIWITLSSVCCAMGIMPVLVALGTKYANYITRTPDAYEHHLKMLEKEQRKLPRRR